MVLSRESGTSVSGKEVQMLSCDSPGSGKLAGQRFAAASEKNGLPENEGPMRVQKGQSVRFLFSACFCVCFEKKVNALNQMTLLCLGVPVRRTMCCSHPGEFTAMLLLPFQVVCVKPSFSG